MNARAILLVTVLFLTGLSRSSFGNTILFDNGSFSGPQELRNNACSTFNDDGVGCKFIQVEGQFTVYEDFTLENDSVITEIEWHQIETLPENYLHTEITFWSGIPSPNSGDGLLLSIQVIADKVLSLNDPPFGSPPEFSALNSVSGLGIELAAGTYWVGIHNEWQIGGVSSWSQTFGGPDTIGGRYQSTGDDARPLNFFADENSAFRIIGSTPGVVPEPSTMLLLGSGLAGLGWYRRRRKREV